MVGYTFLYNAGVRKMKQQLAPEQFGQPYYLHATRTNLGPIRHDVNAIWDLAPHDIAIFNYLLELEPRWASAVGTRVGYSSSSVYSPRWRRLIRFEISSTCYCSTIPIPRQKSGSR